MSDPYQVRVSYDSRLLIPGPRIRLERIAEKSGDGTTRSSRWRISVSGTLDSLKGSPDHTGAFQEDEGYPDDASGDAELPEARVANLTAKMRAMTLLFKEQGKLFEVTPGNNATGISFRPIWGPMAFAEGEWFNVIDYSIEGTADVVAFGDYLASESTDGPESEAEEAWSLERQDEVGRVYRLTHTVASTQPTRYDDTGTKVEGWVDAKAIVIAALGFSSNQLIAAGVLGLTDFAPYNRVRSQTIDTAAGRFSCTETWLAFNPSDQPTGLTGGVAIEVYNSETSISIDSGLYTVSLSGTITGLEVRNGSDVITSTRWASAQARSAGLSDSWAASLAASLSGVTLNPKPTRSSLGRNPVDGVIQWSYSFDSRIQTSDPTNILSEIITYEYELASDVVARIGIPGRAAGPVLQDIDTITEKALTISVESQLRPQYGQSLASPTYNMTSEALAALGFVPSQLFIVSDKPRWIPRLGKYTRTTTFLYQ